MNYEDKRMAIGSNAQLKHISLMKIHYRACLSADWRMPVSPLNKAHCTSDGDAQPDCLCEESSDAAIPTIRKSLTHFLSTRPERACLPVAGDIMFN